MLKNVSVLNLLPKINKENVLSMFSFFSSRLSAFNVFTLFGGLDEGLQFISCACCPISWPGFLFFVTPELAAPSAEFHSIVDRTTVVPQQRISRCAHHMLHEE